MLTVILVLQIAVLLVLSALYFRKPAAAPDPLVGEISDKLTRLDDYTREALAQMRREAPEEAARTRRENADSSADLRKEVVGSITTLGKTLTEGLDSFREDNRTSGEQLRKVVQGQMDSIAQRLVAFMSDTNEQQTALRESLNTKLTGLMDSNATHQDKLRTSVEERLTKLNEDNSKELEKMRQTVDEKLSETLQTRLTESFGQVTDQLNKVHSGLGEMTKLSDGVNDLSRIFTNVKARGGFAEVQLGMLLEQMLAPSQFVRNAKVKEGSLEVVEFAVRFPGHPGEILLPIDAKFPREDWERLEAAYESNNPEIIASAGKAFESAIRIEGERICKKYINPPVTTPHAIMFLPTEGLYAEVMRRDSLQAEIQSKCQVTIAGPSTLSAILTSFQMGFHMLALQEKGDEVWKVLQSAKTEFGKFGILMDKVGNDLLKVHGKLSDVGVRTRAINRTLREVSDPSTPTSTPLAFEDFAAADFSLAASGQED
jgi:DNA recombination protein RmuC